MTTQTSRKGTSLVNVYPCSTLGSALVAVEAEVHGVGMLSESSLSGAAEAVGSLSLWKCLKGPWEESFLEMWGLK